MRPKPGYVDRLVQIAHYIIPRGLLRAGSWGLVDQSLISGTNFLVTIIAARALGPSAFGLFSIFLTVLFMIESIQRALITAPHNVLGAAREPEDYARYTSSVAQMQVLLALIILGIGIVAAIGFMAIDPGIAGLVIAATVACTAWQMQEFARRALYTEFRVKAATIMDGLTYLSRFPLIAAAISLSIFNSSTLMLVFAITWSLGAIIGLWSMRYVIRRGFDWSVPGIHWDFGRWLFASNAFSHLPRYASAAVLSAVLSVGAYGGYRALDQLSNASNVPLAAMGNVLRPRLSADAKHGAGAVWRTVMPIALIGTVGCVAFGGALIILRDPLIELVFGAEYLAYSSAIYLVALLPLITLLRSLLITSLQAMRDTRPIFSATAVGSILGSIAGSTAVYLFGLPAAASIVALFGLISIVWLAVVWKRHLGGALQPSRNSNLVIDQTR